MAGVRRVGRKMTTSIKHFGHGVGSGLRKGAGKIAKYGSIVAAGLQIGGAAMAATGVGLPLAAAMETGAAVAGVGAAGAGLAYKLMT